MGKKLNGRTTSEAQQSCKNLVSDPVGEEENPQAEAIIQTVVQLKDEWYDLLAPQMQFPEVEVRVMTEDVMTSAYHLNKRYIRLGVLDSHGADFVDVATVLGPVYAHEFGHAIFSENFVVKWRDKTQKLSELITHSAMEVEMANELPHLKTLNRELKKINNLIQLATSTHSPNELARLKELRAQKEEQLGMWVPNLFLLEKIYAFTAAQNELFADCFAVLFWKDPHIVAKALAPAERDELALIEDKLLYRGRNKDIEVTPRDFALVSFKNWQKESSLIYTLLDPTRGVLWELYMKNLPREEIPLFLKVFLAVTAQQLVEQLEVLDRGEEFHIVPDQYNREFLRLFRQEALKQGLSIRK